MQKQMGKNTRASGKGKKVVEHNEQDGMSVHSPCKIASSAEEQSQVELEIRLLEVLEIYPLAKLKGVHRHFVLYGLAAHLRRSTCRTLRKEIGKLSFNRPFSPDDVLKLLDRFYNLDMVKPDEEDAAIFNKEEVFSLPDSYFSEEP